MFKDEIWVPQLATGCALYCRQEAKTCCNICRETESIPITECYGMKGKTNKSR